MVLVDTRAIHTQQNGGHSDMLQAVDDIILAALCPCEAISSFLTFSRFSPLVANLSDDGMEMTYTLQDKSRAMESLSQARLVIEVFNLPLEATLDIFEVGGFIVEATLILTYVKS